MLINKVSELEWYLSYKKFENNINNNEITQNQITIQKFHKMWENLKRPDIYGDAMVLYSPFDVNLTLHPFTSVLIPLGFILPDDFLWIQMLDGKLLFSNGTVHGTAGAVGSILKITNMTNQIYPFSLKKDEPIASGIFMKTSNPNYEYKRILLKEANKKENNEVNFSFFIPGVFDDAAICSVIDFLPTNFYITVSKKDNVRFMIHRAVDVLKHPDTDPIIEVITSDDIYRYQLTKAGVSSEYLLRRREQLFEDKYQMVAGTYPEEGKRYMIPVHCAVDIII